MSGRFTPEETQALHGLIESGVFLSAEKLGQLSGIPWDIVSSSIEEMPVVRVLSIFHQDADSHHGVHLKSTSLLPAEVMVFFKEPSVKRLTEAVLAQSPGMRKVPEPEKAVMTEVSNIIGQAVMKTIANSLKISLVLSVPALHVGRKSVIFAEAVGALKEHEETVMLLRLDMSSPRLAAECSLALLLHVELMRRLLKKAAEQAS